MKPSYVNQLFVYLMAVALLLIAPISHAAGEARTERVAFKKGSNGAVIQGRIKGYQTVDYVLGAREGQTMTVSLSTKHGATYFNILAPGETDVAMFNGSDNQNRFEGTLPASGDYKIRVYMMRSAARRNEIANYRLDMKIAGTAQAAAKAPSGDATVAGTGFNATGRVPCSMGQGQPTGSCAFGVKRSGNGDALVTVTKADGRQRVIFFEKGRATGYDQSQADRGEFKAKKEADLNVINIGEERYEIPDAVVSGG